MSVSAIPSTGATKIVPPLSLSVPRRNAALDLTTSFWVFAGSHVNLVSCAPSTGFGQKRFNSMPRPPDFGSRSLSQATNEDQYPAWAVVGKATLNSRTPHRIAIRARIIGTPRQWVVTMRQYTPDGRRDRGGSE